MNTLTLIDLPNADASSGNSLLSTIMQLSLIHISSHQRNQAFPAQGAAGSGLCGGFQHYPGAIRLLHLLKQVRQGKIIQGSIQPGAIHILVHTPVSYPHLDVYKRQDASPAHSPGILEAPPKARHGYGAAYYCIFCVLELSLIHI